MKLLVLGIGNVLYSDEGVGVHFVKMLEKNYNFKSENNQIDFIDGGTLANLLLYIMEQYDEILIVDCIDADGGEIGDVYYFDYEAMPKSISWSGSAHEIEMLQTLQMMDLSGDRPKTHILAVVPKRVEPLGVSISDEVFKAVETLEKTALKHIHARGFDYEKISDYNIRQVAQECEKKGFR